MTRTHHILALAAALALSLLAACASVARVDAGGDVHAFLVSVRDNDRQAFERYVDRPALKAQLESRIVQTARDSRQPTGAKLAALLLAGPAADLAGDTLLQPRVFRVAAEYLGYSPSTPIPNRLAIAGALKYRPDGRVCAVAKRNGQCLFVFTNEGGTWKLTGFEGDVNQLKGVLR